MSLAISTKTVRAAIGTEFRPRATVRDKSTRVASDLSLHTVSFAIKTTADETEVYLVEPTAGTGDDDGHLDATISDTLMKDVPAGDCVGEFAASLSGSVVLRVQFPIHVEPRVIVPDTTP